MRQRPDPPRETRLPNMGTRVPSAANGARFRAAAACTIPAGFPTLSSGFRQFGRNFASRGGTCSTPAVIVQKGRTGRPGAAIRRRCRDPDARSTGGSRARPPRGARRPGYYSNRKSSRECICNQQVATVVASLACLTRQGRLVDSKGRKTIENSGGSASSSRVLRGAANRVVDRRGLRQ